METPDARDSNAPPPVVAGDARLLLVGLTGCDQGTVSRLIAAGRLPMFARLRALAAELPLVASEPLQGEAIWATAATGRLPHRHGILGPFVPRPDGGGGGPIGRPDWRAPPLWQLLEAAGLRTITVGWPATVPATGWAGVHVDGRFSAPTGPDAGTWALPRSAVSPPDLAEELRALRLHPTEIEGATLLPFVPRLREIDQYRDSGLADLAVTLASAATQHAAATGLLETRRWDVALLHYDWLAAVQRRFDGADPAGPFAGVVDAAYDFTDAMLARLAELAGPGAAIWVLSPAGTRSGASGVAFRSGGGFLLAHDVGIPVGTQPPARLVDVAPSLLARFGLSTPCDGRALPALAPDGPRRIVSVPELGEPAPDRHVEALREAGYEDGLPQAAALAMNALVAGQLALLGEAQLAAGELGPAEASLLAARRLLPPESPIGLQRLALCRLLRNDAEGARTHGEALLQLAPQLGWGDVIIAASHALRGEAPKAWPHMIRAAEKAGDDPELRARLGGVALLLREDQSAARHFRAALALDPDLAAAREGLAMAEQLGREYDAAARTG